MLALVPDVGAGWVINREKTMKKLFMGLIVAIFAVLPAFAADPVEGVWKTQVDDGSYAYVTFSPCGEKLCGVITQTFNSSGEYQSENIGRNIV